MKTSKLILAIFVCMLIVSCSSETKQIREAIKSTQTVNAVIGDVSYNEVYGYAPTAQTNEVVRIQTHLKYVEQLLRNKNVAGLTNEQKVNRHNLLGLLNEYWMAGVFPKNYDYPDQRVPCFIDKHGNICAVGYLIEKTAGREVAEQINTKHQYEHLLAMNDPAIDSWALTSGLTMEELALIQPSYRSYEDKYISPGNAVSSSVLGGLNLSLTTVNAIQIGRGSTNKKVTPIIGLVTGVGQIVLGAFTFPTREDRFYATGNIAETKLSMFNIGLGTSTIALSTWNLIANRKRKEKSTSYNIYGFPTQDGDMAFGFSFSKRF